MKSQTRTALSIFVLVLRWVVIAALAILVARFFLNPLKYANP